MLIYCTWALRFSDTGLTLETGIVSCIYYTHSVVGKSHLSMTMISLLMPLSGQLLPGLFVSRFSWRLRCSAFPAKQVMWRGEKDGWDRSSWISGSLRKRVEELYGRQASKTLPSGALKLTHQLGAPDSLTRRLWLPRLGPGLGKECGEGN